MDVEVPQADRDRFSLTDAEIAQARCLPPPVLSSPPPQCRPADE